MAQKDFDDGPKPIMLGFEGRMEADCPSCGEVIVQEGTFHGAIVDWECSCGAKFKSETLAVEMPRYFPE